MLNQRTVHTIAAELALLRQQRPNYRTLLWSVSEADTKTKIYKEHMHKEFLLEQELYGRIGIENGNILVKNAQETLKMFS